jgi:hypothetical protein
VDQTRLIAQFGRQPMVLPPPVPKPIGHRFE